MRGRICASSKGQRRPSSFPNKTNFVIEQSHMDGFEILAFESDGMTGEMEDEFARFVELDGNKVGIGERPAIARLEDDI